ncbi:MAG TPA: cell division protein FtsX, partial [Bacteroidales bacterium]|nr:cell division protein FtsX [Bacteroidales bacterium]
MFQNLINHSIKSFRKQKAYLIINIIGLSIGIASSLLITLYVINELGYDRYNEKSDRIYKLYLNGKIGGQEVSVTSTAAVIAPTMHKDFPEVESFCRINQFGNTIIRHDEQSFEERYFMEADSSFFKIFSIKLIQGDPAKVLSEPNRCVISETTAKKIFSNDNPVGKVINVGSGRVTYTISGVMEDIPVKSHFDANIIGSFMTNPRSQETFWLNNSFDTYLLLHHNTSPKPVEDKIPAMLEKYAGAQLQEFLGISFTEFLEKGNKYSIYLQPLLKIHLDPTIDHFMKPSIDPKYLYIFGSIALLIILIAAINFMNLSTARAARRAKEIGIKKVGGASRNLLIKQFLTESTIISFAALIIAVLAVKLLLPCFNNLLDTELSLALLGSWYTIPVLLLFTIIVGIMAGSYPAFYMSSITPYKVLRSNSIKISGHGRLRSVLVILQFAASLMLIIGTIIMYRQINYLVNKDLGFNKNQLMVISRTSAIGDRLESFKSIVKDI